MINYQQWFPFDDLSAEPLKTRKKKERKKEEKENKKEERRKKKEAVYVML